MTTIQTESVTVPRSWRVRAFGQAVVSHGREYATTFLTEFAVMASQIVAYKLAAHYLGKEGFSEYALARRTVTLLVPIPVFGLAVALPRYIGFCNGRGDQSGTARYYGATLVCVSAAALLVFLLINLFAGLFAFLFFGSRNYAYLALPLSVMILGLCLHTVVCGYFRGQLAMNCANVLQFINLAVVPIVAFIAFRNSLSRVLSSIGLVSMFVAGTGLILTPATSAFGNNWKEAKELLGYGIQRVPGDFILMALFTLPATFVAHLKGVPEAGFVAFGISIVSMVGAIFAPVGLVLLPKATFMLADGAHVELRRHVGLILRVTAIASALIVSALWVSIPALTRVFLGAGFEPVVPTVRVLIFAALPYSLYLVVRNLVDAYHEYGVTALILILALCVFLTSAYLGRHSVMGVDVILAAFLLAMVAAATLSGLECRRVLRA